MATRTLYAFFCSLLFLFSLQAEPANILVGDLTFTRPERWTWQSPPKNAPALTQFVIPKTSEQDLPANVRFYLNDKETDATIELWKTFFHEPKDAVHFLEDRKMIGKRTLVYLTMRGSYGLKGQKGKPGYLHLGAIIPYGEKSIQIRMVGPQKVVETAVGEFKQMVENALKEKENE